MYLSRVQLNLQKRKTLKALSSLNLFHGAVETCFNGERGRNLWRIDTLNGLFFILIVSQNIPDFTHFIDQFGYENDESSYATKDYQPFIDSISAGQKWNFRLTANPTNYINQGQTVRGKIVAHITTTHQKAWLMKKAESNGFTISEMDFDIVKSEWFSFRKKTQGPRVTMLAVTYEGMLTVTDPLLFRKVLVNGLGREKAYGMGMLTVVKAR